MKTPEIKLTGWKAIVVLAAVVLFALFQFQAAKASLPTEGADQLKVYLTSVYTRAGLPELQRAIAANDSAAVEALTADILVSDRLIFRAIKARGSIGDMVVRVDIQVDGGAPPDGVRVRYFRMHYTPVIGWVVDYETTKLAYYLEIF